MTKTARGITINDEIWEAAKKQAEKENRTLSNFIETILKNYLEEQKETGKPG